MYYGGSDQEFNKLKKLLQCYAKKCSEGSQNEGGNGIDEAPADGKIYGRKDKVWTEIVATANFHNLLSGKQGGSETLNQFYHLTEDQLRALEAMIANSPHPNYILPTTSLNMVNTTFEVGVKGVENIVNTFSQNDGGTKDAERIIKDGTLVSSTGTYVETLNVKKGTTVYSSSVDYQQGPIKTNSIGVPDPIGRIQIGTVNSSPVTITGIIPWFWKTFDTPPDLNSLNLSQFNKVVGVSSGTIRATLSFTNKYVVFVVPSSSALKTKWFVSELNRGNVGAGNFILDPVTKVLSSPTILWQNENFRVYASAYLTDVEPILELRNN